MDQLYTLWVPVAALFLVSLFFPVLLFVLSVNLGPQKPDKLNLKAYESGIVAVGEGQRRLPVKFYRLAVLFILFDIDIIFLFPYAVAIRRLGYFGLWSILIFVVIFVLGDLWIWKKGVLEWE